MSLRRCASGCVLVLTLLADRAAHAELTIAVRGSADCPSTDMVRAALKALSPNAEWPSQTVTVDVTAERLSLTLGEDQGAHREIPAASDCQARAETVALVVRAWSGELPPQPTSAPVLTVAPPAPAPIPASVSNHALELDASAFYSPLWGHAFGIWLAMGRTPRRGGLGFRAFAAYQLAQDVALAAGHNQLLRVLAGAAPTFHVQREKVFASADVGLLATFTRAQGHGYDTSASAHTWNLGALADVRGGVSMGHLRFWLNARVLRLFHQETITITSSADSSRLNPWDVQLGIGMGARFP